MIHKEIRTYKKSLTGYFNFDFIPLFCMKNQFAVLIWQENVKNVHHTFIFILLSYEKTRKVSELKGSKTWENVHVMPCFTIKTI